MADQKKPNIVMILSDDVGAWNISAYHRGMMGGRRPTSTGSPVKVRCSPTITAAVLHSRPLGVHHRSDPVPHRPAEGWFSRGQAGHPGQDPTIAEFSNRWATPQPDRQEPSRRPQRISAHRPRLRRVLRHPLPPQRHGGARRRGLPEDPAVPARFGPRNIVDTSPPTSTTRPKTRAGAGSASR